MLAGAGLAVWASSGVFLHSLPRLLAEVSHQAEFRPAPGSRVIDARCTNWNLVMFTVCTAKAVAADGRVLEFNDWGLGPAGSQPVQLLQTSAREPLYTTSFSLMLMTQRIVALSLASVFLAFVDIILVLSPFLIARRARACGRTIWEQIKVNQAVVAAATTRRR